MKKKCIRCWLLPSCSQFRGVVGSAADTVLDTVYVNADRDKAEDTVGTLPGGFIKEEPSVGLLGHQDVMDAPLRCLKSVRRRSKLSRLL